MAEVVVTGLQETIKALDDLCKTIPNRDMKIAGAKALTVIGQAILTRTPHDTGALATSLTGDLKVESAGVVGGAYLVRGWVGFVGKFGVIAMSLEYGHRIVIRSKEYGRATARPFMRPALDASAAPAFEAFAASMAATLATSQSGAKASFSAQIDSPDTPELLS